MFFYTDIFVSLQGEGPDAGYPTTFVRLHGCPLSCKWCDTPQKTRRKISLENMVKKVISLETDRVCITGGEPMTYEETIPLVYELVGEGYKVSVETNGCMELSDDRIKRSYSYVMDVKCPSSGMSSKNILTNFSVLQPCDTVKYVIANRGDYTFAKKIFLSNPTKASTVFSPVFNEENKPLVSKDLAEWILLDKLNVRLQMQLHKIAGFK